jgi:ferritin-like metal-binding protein YciE
MEQIDFSVKQPDAEELLLNIIRKCCWCESEMSDILNDIMKLTTQKEILHLIETYKDHIGLQAEQLNSIFDESGGKKNNALKCPTFEAMMHEGIRSVKSVPADSVLRDMNIVIMMQQMALFKVSNYTISASFSRILDMVKTADTLEQILFEEKERYAELSFAAATRIFNK